jgi:transcription-repair coupling factor
MAEHMTAHPSAASWIRDAALRSPSLDDALAYLRAAAAPSGPRPLIDGAAPLTLVVTGLAGATRALYAAALCGELRAPVLVVAADVEEAEAFRDDLSFLLEPDSPVYFPPRDVPPFSDRPTHALVESQRIEALATLATGTPGVVITTPEALATRVPSRARVREGLLRLHVNQEIDMDLLAALLMDLGYVREPVVEEFGMFARRGAIVDVFSFGFTDPLRIEFDGDRIHSMRMFSVETQRSIERLTEVQILPRRELVVTPERLRRASERMRELRDHAPAEHAEPLTALADLLADAVQPDAPGADTLTRWAHLLDQELTLPLDLLPPETIVLVAGADRAAQTARAFWEDVCAQHAELHPAFHALGGPEALYAPPSEVAAAFARLRVVSAEQLEIRAAGRRERLHGASHARLAVSPEETRALGAFGDEGEAVAVANAHMLPPADVDASESDDEDDSDASNVVGDERRAGDRTQTVHEYEPTDRSPTQTNREDSIQPLITPAAATARVAIAAREQEAVARDIGRLRTHLAALADGGYMTVILCESVGQRERLVELLPDTSALLEVGTLSAGFTLTDARLAVLTDHQIFARLWRRQPRKRPRAGLSLAALSALVPGDYLVHIDHGIGVFRGMERLTMNGQETDCLRIDYAGGDRLYLPIDQLGLVQRYAVDDSRAPALSKLGGTAWTKTKAKAKRAILDMADELIKTYAVRRAQEGHAFGPDTVWQSELESAFPYEETPDQERAIVDVKRDMESPQSMDRLICGDVGYGKTEVAVRAAFKAAMDGRQTAVLVPTTILAEQHGATFTERMAGFPVRVEVLSRFRTPAEQKAIVKGLKDGTVDIVIGTHRLLSKDVSFRDLGLVVIDEEHRFGVRHKERIRTMRALADVLTLTATPIPRTLHLSLLGARDMSVIETPPPNRLPIHTEVIEWDESIMADALLREADRGGQSFVIHNRVETLHSMATFIQKLVPSLRVGVAHGQMNARNLERVMHDFLARRYDILVCTMIVESGLDIPTANTMIVNRADTFGLAELYQLRGRIGRSSERAYAYLVVPKGRVLTETAEKRLRVLEEYGDLGAGFQIALRDLEIRGAGNILGPEQHGFMLSVGFDLYCRLLDEAVHELKGEPLVEEADARLTTDIEAFLPEDYVTSEADRLALYKRLADAKDAAQVDGVEEEIRDRFGALPAPAVHLVVLRRLRALARAVRARTLTVRRTFVEIELGAPLTRAAVERLIRVVSGRLAPEFETGRRFAVRARITGGPDAALVAADALLRALEHAASVPSEEIATRA